MRKIGLSNAELQALPWTGAEIEQNQSGWRLTIYRDGGRQRIRRETFNTRPELPMAFADIRSAIPDFPLWRTILVPLDCRQGRHPYDWEIDPSKPQPVKKLARSAPKKRVRKPAHKKRARA